MASQPNNVTTLKPPTGLALLRAPFPDNQISKLPKESRSQIDARKADKNLMEWNCKVCGGMHHKNAVHLDYVGHAALTDRLLDTDPAWSWEPLALDQQGLPALDRNDGLWIRLTVLGVTRLGYGHADGKVGGNAIKEAIGDALRNAAMRFGAALDLWHKGDLHADDDEIVAGGQSSDARSAPGGNSNTPLADAPQGMPDAEWAKLAGLIKATSTDMGAMLKHYGVANLRMLDQDQYQSALAMLNAKLAKLAKADTDAKLTKPNLAEELGDAIEF